MNLRNGLLVALGIVLAIAGYRMLFQEQMGQLRAVPANLQGVWVTTNPEYGDGYVELGADFITFGSGAVTSKRFKVTGLDRGGDRHPIETYTVYFRDVGKSTLSRSFTFSKDGGGRLVFVNQPEVVWVRDR